MTLAQLQLLASRVRLGRQIDSLGFSASDLETLLDGVLALDELALLDRLEKELADEKRRADFLSQRVEELEGVVRECLAGGSFKHPQIVQRARAAVGEE